jgi:hypothetical protein
MSRMTNELAQLAYDTLNHIQEQSGPGSMNDMIGSVFGVDRDTASEFTLEISDMLVGLPSIPPVVACLDRGDVATARELQQRYLVIFGVLLGAYMHRTRIAQGGPLSRSDR